MSKFWRHTPTLTPAPRKAPRGGIKSGALSAAAVGGPGEMVSTFYSCTDLGKKTMQMDRNLPNNHGRGKYALLKLRNVRQDAYDLHEAMDLLERAGVLDWGDKGTESEFFVIRLKDRYAQGALDGYANEVGSDDPEWQAEVREMARRAGPAHPACKYPD